MNDLDWVKVSGEDLLAPDFGRPRGRKERPIDVRAEAIGQVGPQRRSEIHARRTEEWREHRRSDSSGAPRSRREESSQLRTPEVRRRRRADPNYPSSWFR